MTSQHHARIGRISMRPVHADPQRQFEAEFLWWKSHVLANEQLISTKSFGDWAVANKTRLANVARAYNIVARQRA